jgi:prophage regulatory protein
MKKIPSPTDRIIRKPELLARIGLSDPTIWRMERDGKFPRRLRLGGNSCGWLQSEVDIWLQRLAEAREA